ncbi:MAG TPA: PHB depolymerase family esterase [Mycobacteriales bacterium]|nr:PHB depolymerase family esterase [Mycobacteriales bacterium]
MRRIRALIVLSLLALITGTTASAGTAAHADPVSNLLGTVTSALGVTGGTDDVVSLPFDGAQRSYRAFVPTDLPAGPRPVVVFLHWLSGSAADAEQSTQLDVGATVAHAIVVYPDGLTRSWNAGTCCAPASTNGNDDVGFIDAVLDDVSGRFSVDASRIAVGGFSNGGMLAYRYACERSARVTTFFMGSAVPLSSTCHFDQPVAILDMQGANDTTVPWAGTRTSSLVAGGVLAPVLGALGGMAWFDGCGPLSSSVVSALVTRYVATSCPTGASVTLERSATMPHTWATGPNAPLLYGIDETWRAWGFVSTRWR